MARHAALVALLVVVVAFVVYLLTGCASHGGRVVVLFGIGNDAARGDLEDIGPVVSAPPARERPRMPDFNRGNYPLLSDPQ